ncbi:SRPBCC family protein [Rhodococcus sp. NPDC056960]|uniref:SRPBCC family protein n=1 Tax=Rhodococcus sp. NPDC056960 TaxID=3345982 RepID=UPI003645339B
MMHTHHSAVAIVPIDVAFDFIGNYRNVPSWAFGIYRFDPTGTLDHGLGATFDAAMQVGFKTIHSILTVTAWERNRLIALDSIDGFRNTSIWRFSATGICETQLTVDFSYQPPSGLTGKTLGRLLEPFAAQAIGHTELNLRRRIEDFNADIRTTHPWDPGNAAAG